MVLAIVMAVMMAVVVVVMVDGMAEVVEQNVAPRILGDVPAQLSHSSAKLEDSHHAEIVGKLDRGNAEPQQRPVIKKPQQTQAKYRAQFITASLRESSVMCWRF